jgi:thiosulfate/3-mercaptopyruvate sulfurtransferase
MAEPYPIVTTTWLDQNLKRLDLRIVDIRGRIIPASEPPPHYFSYRHRYDESHIPGAVFVDWIRDITVDGPQNMQIAPPEKFAVLMRELGVGPETMVVAYDDHDGMFAARLWWALNYYGHSHAAVLDGGWDKWIAEDRVTTDNVPQVESAQFVPTVNTALRRSADDVKALLGTQAKLIDSRSEAEFAGESSRARRKGHIPGAVNLPRRALLAPDGTLLPVGVLQDKFAAAGVEPGTNVINYCNSGVSAAFSMLAMRVAGIESSIYDGSWKEWGNDDSLPME